MKVLFDKDKQKVPVKCWCENPEDGAIQQAVDVSNHPAIFKHVALAPDTHQGYGLPIGGIAALNGCISPYMVGVDIACGMMSCKTNLKADDISKEDLQKIINQIKRDVPMGFKHNPQQKTKNNMDKARELVSKFYEIET